MSLTWFAWTCFTITMVTVGCYHFQKFSLLLHHCRCTYACVCMDHFVLLCQCVRLAMNNVDCVCYHSLCHYITPLTSSDCHWCTGMYVCTYVLFWLQLVPCSGLHRVHNTECEGRSMQLAVGVTPGWTRPCTGECVYTYMYGPDTPQWVASVRAGAVMHTVH